MASSAEWTCSESLSASLYIATVRIPSLFAVLMILQAISPLLAIRIFSIRCRMALSPAEGSSENSRVQTWKGLLQIFLRRMRNEAMVWNRSPESLNLKDQAEKEDKNERKVFLDI